MPDVPWWGVVSSAAAPVLGAAGWSVAAGLQPRSFDPVAEPVSALAALGAADRWVMSLTFVVVGACVFVTGLALRPAAAPGRLILMAGGGGGHARCAQPQAPGDQLSGAAYDLRGGRVRRDGGLAGGGLAARAFGAVGPAADGIGWCRCGAAGPDGAPPACRCEALPIRTAACSAIPGLDGLHNMQATLAIMPCRPVMAETLMRQKSTK